MSAILVELSSFATRIVLAAIVSQTLLYATALCFFFNVYSGLVELMTTLLLSQYTLVAPSVGMQNLCNLYRRPSINSTAILVAINLEPNVEV